MTNHSRRSFLAALSAGAVTACVGDDTTPVTTRYRTAVDRVMRQYRIPGALAAVRFPGDPEWAVALGEGDLLAHVPMGLADHGSIRSVTKSFTVTVILQLVRAQALRLADPIERWVPGIPNGGEITLAYLAGMQSGIAEYTDSPQFRAVFGADVKRLKVSSTKSSMGHLIAAAGAVEIAVCALAIARGEMPVNANYRVPDPDCDLNLVLGEAKRQRVRMAMSNSFGFGGSNSCVVLRHPDETDALVGALP